MSEEEELGQAIEDLGWIENVFQLMAEIDDDPSFLQPLRPPRRSGVIRIEIKRVAQLDPRSWQNALAGLSRRRKLDIDEDTIVCEALDGEQRVGLLVLAPDGLVMNLEVVAERQRQGIATQLYRRALAEGYRPRHDWEHMSEDGAAWVHSLQEEQA